MHMEEQSSPDCANSMSENTKINDFVIRFANVSGTI
jgi:hypothetical protein